MLDVELKYSVSDWIDYEKEQLYYSIRERRANALEIMQKMKVDDRILLQIYMTELNTLEYLLMKGEDNYANK